MIEDQDYPSEICESKPYSDLTWSLENGIIVTSRDFSFLAAGGHRVLEYISGKASPDQKSIEAFSSNIAQRAAYSASVGAKFIHVIFPDKQSVLSEEFPLRPLHRLAVKYITQMPEDIVGKIVYPVSKLRSSKRQTFFRHDTHMTDYGSFIVLCEICKKLELFADKDLANIEELISVEMRCKGDLGGKLDPIRFENIDVFKPRWKIKNFHGFTSANDGAVDIFISPDAVLKSRVLIFGDSFFRKMLPQLSGLFGEIICLRTRFFHPEMVNMIMPDIILSGNVERYLGSVSYDGEAHPFMIYPFIKDGLVEAPNAEFTSAYRAMTSLSSEFSKKFFESL